MIYWALFHLSVFSALTCFHFAKDKQWKRFYEGVTIFILIYFSGFRDGLGADYQTYINRLDTFSTLESFILGLSEPLFNVFGFLIVNTILSPIFLFLICAVITNVGICKYLFKENEFAVLAMLIYILQPTMYCMSFNIVRQFFSIGLFYFALSYVGKQPKKYFGIIIVASLMHLSAIILIPMYWMLNYNLRIKHLLWAALFFLALTFWGVNYVSGGAFKYSEMASSDSSMQLSGMFILYDIIFAIAIFNRNIFNGMPIIVRNIFFLFIGLINLSFVNYFFYRLSFYFFPAMAIIIPMVLKRITGNNGLNIVIVLLLFVLFYFSLFSSIDNPIVVPSRMLSIESLLDSYYP